MLEETDAMLDCKAESAAALVEASEVNPEEIVPI